MFEKADMNRRSRPALKRLAASLAVNWLLPLLAYSLLRSHFSTDTAALAVSAAIPAAWVIIQMIGLRRMDWIGLLGICGFGLAGLISAVTGGGSLPLKLYHPAVTCLLGLLSLISVAVKKPLLPALLGAFKTGNPQRFGEPAVRRKFTVLTGIWGFLFLADGTAHLILAFSLSTGMYLVVSRIVTLAMLVILFAASKRIMRR